MEPRYEPTYNHNGAEVFLGHAGDIDVWTELADKDAGERWIIVVGPKNRKLRPNIIHNFDVYPAENNVLSSRLLELDGKDIHVELSEMCQVYALCVEHGYITTE